MTTWNGHTPLPVAQGGITRYVDTTHAGNPWAQLGVGVLGIVLAAVLVIGQISVATTRGISVHLHGNVANIEQGNETMLEIIEKAVPAVAMEAAVEKQKTILRNTNDTMGVLNDQMYGIGETTNGMSATVGTMERTSGELATGVASMDESTSAIVRLLVPLPSATGRTHSWLTRIAADSAAINTELYAISNKMSRYGLPKAKNVRGK